MCQRTYSEVRRQRLPAVPAQRPQPAARAHDLPALDRKPRRTKLHRALAEHDPANVRWQGDIGRYVEVFRGADGEEAFTPLEEVWDLAVQRENT